MPTQPNAAASSATAFLPFASSVAAYFRSIAPSAAQRLFLAYAGCACIFLVGVSRFAHSDSGLTSTIHFGSRLEEGRLESVKQMRHRAIEPDSVGYDGQFYAQLAVTPLLTDPHLSTAMDVAAFRCRRILFSWTAWSLGLGRPNWVIHAFAVQNVLFWFATALLLLHWLPPTSWFNFCRWAGILLSSGMLASVSHALTDGPSLFVVLLGVYLCERGWHWTGTALVGISVLGKETNLLAGLGCVELRGVETRNGEASRFAALVAAAPRIALQGLLLVMPLALWLCYVQYRVGTAGSNGTAAFSLPFVSLAMSFKEIAGFVARDGIFGLQPRAAIACYIGLAAQLAYFLTRWQPASRWWRIGIPYAILAVCMGPSVLECFPGASSRSLLPLLVAFNLSLKPSRGGWVLFAAGNLGAIHGLQMLNLLR
jgi:hypothetical protein